MVDGASDAEIDLGQASAFGFGVPTLEFLAHEGECPLDRVGRVLRGEDADSGARRRIDTLE